MDDADAARVRALGEILHEFDLDSIRLRVGAAEYELVRREAAPLTAVGPLPAPAPAAAEAAARSAEAAPVTAAAPPHVRRVTAPVVGIFYRAPSPGAPAFVEVGERVAVGQVLCILEAMKLMNEITSEYAGSVLRVVPENGDLVSLGDDLFWIEP